MTSKALFWMLIGPATWMAILLLVASDKADGSVERAGLRGPPQSCSVSGPPLGREGFQSQPNTEPVQEFFAVRENTAAGQDAMNAPRAL